MPKENPVSPERESKTITTVHGHVVVIKSYLTGREVNKYRNVIFEKTKFKTVPDPNSDPAEGKQIVQAVTESTAAITIEQELAALEICVLSLDGKSENLKERILDLRSEDYTEIDKACAELVKPIFTKAN